MVLSGEMAMSKATSGDLSFELEGLLIFVIY